MKKFWIALVAALSFMATPALSADGTVYVDPDRTIALNGPIFANALSAAHAVDTLSLASIDPIYIIINSPGGSVLAADILIGALKQAKERGVDTVCIVPVLAASAAFQIFLHCSDRFAFEEAALMWHPVRAVIMASTTKQLAGALQSLDRTEDRLTRDLQEALNIPEAVFWNHYWNETLWAASDLEDLTSNFLRTVTGVKGVEYPIMVNPFMPTFGVSDDEPEQEGTIWHFCLSIHSKSRHECEAVDKARPVSTPQR